MLHEPHVSDRADASIQLAALPSAASAGRRFVKTVLQIRDLTEFEDTALLCTSELVTNAVNAADVMSKPGKEIPDTPNNTVTLCLAVTQRQLCIEVWDANPEIPRLQDAGADDECGRGLALVDALSDRWGSDPLAGVHAYGPCKVTWCEWDRVVPREKLTAAFRYAEHATCH